jgi:hypothetical protein
VKSSGNNGNPLIKVYFLAKIVTANKIEQIVAACQKPIFYLIQIDLDSSCICVSRYSSEILPSNGMVLLTFVLLRPWQTSRASSSACN